MEGRKDNYLYAGSNDLDEVGWYDENSGSTTKPVGLKNPNQLGLYDMSGNVWEWCADWFGNYSRKALMNPTGSRDGGVRVLRGGSWFYVNFFCRSAIRFRYFPVGRVNFLGFRVSRHFK
jgi:formylglycine-generating enzyme required for sulfatase activity